MGTLKLICKGLSKSFNSFFLDLKHFAVFRLIINLLFPIADYCLPGLTLVRVRCLWCITAFLESNLHSVLRAGALLTWPACIASRGGQEVKPATHWKDWRWGGRKGGSAGLASRWWGKREGMAKHQARGFTPQRGHSAASHREEGLPALCLLQTPSWVLFRNLAEGRVTWLWQCSEAFTETNRSPASQ